MGLSNVRRTWAVLAAVLAAMAALALPATSASAEDPPGNNGTIKVDGEDIETVPDNDPHVGCVFNIEFFGYDAGGLDATFKFVAIPPTGKNVVLRRGALVLEDDPAGGGTDLDATKTIDLSKALVGKGFTYHPQQGYHIKLVVTAEGSIGNDTKSKVFWVTDCMVVTS